MNKKTIFVIALLLLAAITVAIFNFPRPVASIHINSDTIRLESDMSKKLSITIKPEKVYSFQYKLVSDNEFVAVCEGNTVYAVNEGATHIYATSSNGNVVSNKIKVIVSNNLFDLAAKIVLSESKETADKQEAETIELDDEDVTEEKIAQITYREPAKVYPDNPAQPGTAEDASETTPSPVEPPQESVIAAPPPTGSDTDIVYVTKSGEKYHLSTCTYAKTASPVPRSEAVSEGKTPCKKCNP